MIRNMPNSVKKPLSYFIYLVLGLWCIVCIYDFTFYWKIYPDLAHFVSRLSKFIRAFLIIYFLFYWNNIKDYKKLFLFAVFIVFSFVSNSCTKNWYFFDIFFAPLFLSFYICRKKLLNTLFFFSCIALVSVFVFYSFDLLPSLSFNRDDFTRYALGYVHPNALGFVVLFICVLVVLKKQMLSIYDRVFLLVAVCFCVLVPNSNTAALLISLLFVFSFVSDYLLKQNNSERRASFLIRIVLFFIFSVIVLTYLISYSEACVSFIQSHAGTLSARFSMGKAAMDHYGLSLFGQHINTVLDYDVQVLGKTDYFTVDCAYFYVPITYGTLCYLFYLLVLVFSIKSALNKKYYEMIGVFVLIALYGVSEVVIFSPLFMFVFLVAFVPQRIVDKSEQNCN